MIRNDRKVLPDLEAIVIVKYVFCSMIETSNPHCHLINICLSEPAAFQCVYELLHPFDSNVQHNLEDMFPGIFTITVCFFKSNIMCKCVFPVSNFFIIFECGLG